MVSQRRLPLDHRISLGDERACRTYYVYRSDLVLQYDYATRTKQLGSLLQPSLRQPVEDVGVRLGSRVVQVQGVTGIPAMKPDVDRQYV